MTYNCVKIDGTTVNVPSINRLRITAKKFNVTTSQSQCVTLASKFNNNVRLPQNIHSLMLTCRWRTAAVEAVQMSRRQVFFVDRSLPSRQLKILHCARQSSGTPVGGRRLADSVDHVVGSLSLLSPKTTRDAFLWSYRRASNLRHCDEFWSHYLSWSRCSRQLHRSSHTCWSLCDFDSALVCGMRVRNRLVWVVQL